MLGLGLRGPVSITCLDSKEIEKMSMRNPQMPKTVLHLPQNFFFSCVTCIRFWFRDSRRTKRHCLVKLDSMGRTWLRIKFEVSIQEVERRDGKVKVIFVHVELSKAAYEFRDIHGQKF
jgi:hypothetical protein